MLELSDRAYKTYELGKREPSLETVLKFCGLYGTDLHWLATGAQAHTDGARDRDKDIPKALAIEVATAVYEVASQPPNDLPSGSFTKLLAYVLDQVCDHQKSPRDEAEKVFKIFHDETGGRE